MTANAIRHTLLMFDGKPRPVTAAKMHPDTLSALLTHSKALQEADLKRDGTWRYAGIKLVSDTELKPGEIEWVYA